MIATLAQEGEHTLCVIPSVRALRLQQLKNIVQQHAGRLAAAYVGCDAIPCESGGLVELQLDTVFVLGAVGIEWAAADAAQPSCKKKGQQCGMGARVCVIMHSDDVCAKSAAYLKRWRRLPENSCDNQSCLA